MVHLKCSNGWVNEEDITYRVINFWVGGEIEDDVG